MTHDEESPGHTYGLVREEYHTDRTIRTAYGIAVYAHVADTADACIVASIRDITPDRIAIEDLIRRCNEGNLSPLHLQDVIDDFFDA